MENPFISSAGEKVELGDHVIVGLCDGPAAGARVLLSAVLSEKLNVSELVRFRLTVSKEFHSAFKINSLPHDNTIFQRGPDFENLAPIEIVTNKSRSISLVVVNTFLDEDVETLFCGYLVEFLLRHARDLSKLQVTLLAGMDISSASNSDSTAIYWASKEVEVREPKWIPLSRDVTIPNSAVACMLNLLLVVNVVPRSLCLVSHGKKFNPNVKDDGTSETVTLLGNGLNSIQDAVKFSSVVYESLVANKKAPKETITDSLMYF